MLVLSVDNDSEDARAGIQRYRQVRHRLAQELLEVHNSASLKSGARGLQARKELIAFEKKVEESKNAYGLFPITGFERVQEFNSDVQIEPRS